MMAVTPFDFNRPCVAENPRLRAYFTVLCVTDAELLAIEFSDRGDADLCWYAGYSCNELDCMVVDLFCSCDLDLDPMTFIIRT